MLKRIDRRVTDRLDKAEQRASAVPLRQSVSGHEAEVSLGGICVDVEFTVADAVAGFKVIDLPVATQSQPVHVEPMGIYEPLNVIPAGTKVSGLRVSAMDRSTWGRKRIKVRVGDDGMDQTCFPCRQKFRVYTGKAPATTTGGAIAGGSPTLRERVTEVADAVSTTPGPGKIPIAGPDGKLDSWVSDVSAQIPPIVFSGGHASTSFDGTILMRIECGGA